MKKLILPLLLLTAITANSQTTHQVCISEVTNAPCSNNNGVFTPSTLNIAIGDNIQFTTYFMGISGGYDGSTHQIRFNGGSPQDVVLNVSSNVLSQVTTVTTPVFNTAGTITMECVNSAHCFNFAQLLSGWSCTGYSITVGTTTEIAEEKLKSKIRVYPNPTSEVINVNLYPILGENPKVYIIDVLGKTIASMEKLTSQRLTVDVASYKKGLYFVKIVSDKGAVIKKIIVE
jgi:plastocyanin